MAGLLQSAGDVGKQGAGTALNLVDLIQAARTGGLGQNLAARSTAMQDPGTRSAIEGSPFLAGLYGQSGSRQPTAVDTEPGGPSLGTPEMRFRANLPPAQDDSALLNRVASSGAPYSASLTSAGRVKGITLRSEPKPNTMEFHDLNSATSALSQLGPGYRIYQHPERGTYLLAPGVDSMEAQLAQAGLGGGSSVTSPRQLGRAPTESPTPPTDTASPTTGSMGGLRPRRLTVGGGQKQAAMTFESPDIPVTPKFAEFAASNYNLDVRDPNASPAARKEAYTAFRSAEVAQKQSLEATRTLSPSIAKDVAGWDTFRILTDDISKSFSPEEIRHYAGLLQSSSGRVGQIIGGIQSFMGNDPGTADPRFATFRAKVGALKAAYSGDIGKQMTKSEMAIVRQYVPSGDEIGGPDEFMTKLAEFPKVLATRRDSLLRMAGMSRSEAREGGPPASSPPPTTTSTLPTSIDPAQLDRDRKLLGFPSTLGPQSKANARQLRARG